MFVGAIAYRTDCVEDVMTRQAASGLVLITTEILSGTAEAIPASNIAAINESHVHPVELCVIATKARFRHHAQLDSQVVPDIPDCVSNLV